jgi:hypothetical protein
VVLNYFYKLIAMDNDNSMAYSISQSFQGGNMPAPPQFLYKQIYIHPQEADRIAEEIRNLIQRLEKEHAGLDTSFLHGVYGWLGHQKDLFWEEARPRIRKLAEFMDMLRIRENYYRTLMVEVWEKYDNPEWEVYMKAQN